jgi:hypothetical protein
VNHLGTLTRIMPRTASVTRTDSAAMPMNAFGTLSVPSFTISDRHEPAAAEHESTALMSRLSDCLGCRASCRVSAERMNDTNNATADAASMTPYVHAAPCRQPLGADGRAIVDVTPAAAVPPGSCVIMLLI